MRRDKSSNNFNSIESESVCKQTDIVFDVRRSGLSGADTSGNESVAGNDDKWCQLSNTAPPTLHLQTKVAIDYLDFWVYGQWFGKAQSLFRLLDNAKEKAQTENNGVKISLGGVDFLVERWASGRGSHSCRWHLFHRGIFIGICRHDGDDAKRPLAKIEIKGEVLTQSGVKNSLKVVNRILKALRIGYKRSLISRIDIKADQFKEPLATYVHAFEDNRVITRARKVSTFGTLSKPETINVGDRKTNRVICRFYDKLAEIASKPDKEAMFYQCITGGEVPEHCTRVEFEIRRGGFKELGIGSFEDCFGKLVEVVGYLTHTFLRIANRQVDRRHTERSEYASCWIDVRDAMFGFARSFRQSPAKIPERVPLDSSRHRSNMVGHLISWMLKEGICVKNANDIVQFAKENFLPDLTAPEVLHKFDVASRKFEHKNGIEVGQFFENRNVETKQALTGVKKIVDSDGPASSVRSPTDLFDENSETGNSQKRAA